MEHQFILHCLTSTQKTQNQKLKQLLQPYQVSVKFETIKFIEENSILKQIDQDDQRPFACQITQINSIGVKNIASQSLLYQDFEIPINKNRLTLVDDRIYYAKYQDAKDYNLIEAQKVTLIVNCAADHCKNWFLNDIQYKWYFIKDQQDQNVQCLFYQIYQSIKQTKGNTIIHCYGPPCRSSSILIALMMIKHNYNYQKAYDLIKQKIPKFQIRKYMSQQLMQLQNRINNQIPINSYKLFTICSYQKQQPSKMVAKYMGTYNDPNKIYQVSSYSKTIHIKVQLNNISILIFKDCNYQQLYYKFTLNYVSLLQKYENAPKCKINTCKIVDEHIKSNIKPIGNKKILILDPKAIHKPPGYLGKQLMTFKYPLLRPVNQHRKQDGYYFLIKQKNDSAHVNMIKGIKWVGYENDKDQFFDKIVKIYLTHTPHQKILVQQNAEDSIFDDGSLIHIQ